MESNDQPQPAGESAPACEHKSLRPDFYLGSRTGDMVCNSCGEEFSPAEMKAMRS